MIIDDVGGTKASEPSGEGDKGFDGSDGGGGEYSVDVDGGGGAQYVDLPPSFC